MSGFHHIGPNIRELRRKAGWTQTELAQRAGVQLPPLGRIERGEAVPSGRVLMGLIRALGVSADAILGEGDRRSAGLALGGLPFRVDRDGSVLPTRCEQAGVELVRAMLALEDFCGAPKRATIPLTLPFDAVEDGMEALAEQVRTCAGLGHAVVFDYLELFETLGLRVAVLPLPREVDSFAHYDPEHLNAFFFLNQRTTGERQLFRLAYELGHVYLQTARLSRPAGPHPDPKQTGRCARKFAAYFLMPARAVRATVAQLGVQPGAWTLELLIRVKHRFGVSTEAFLYRLNELGLIQPALVEQHKEAIRRHYQEGAAMEPGHTRRILSINGRIWDLVCVTRLQPDPPDELAEVEATLNRWKVARI